MINRRHLRIKVMQTLYAARINITRDTKQHVQFLRDNIRSTYDLYLIHLALLTALRKKAENIYLKSKDLYFQNRLSKLASPNFKDNKYLLLIEEELKDDKISAGFWEEHFEMLEKLWNELIKKNFYKKFTLLEEPGDREQYEFLHDMFMDFIAPHEKLFEFYSETRMGWADDLPLVNTQIMKQIKYMTSEGTFALDKMFKKNADLDFAVSLLNKGIVHYDKYEQEIDLHTPNWDAERISPVDKALMILALTEFTGFPSIPTRVSINEYIEIAKDYSTPKSAFFINGVLDKLLKKFTEEGLIEKNQRGMQ